MKTTMTLLVAAGVVLVTAGTVIHGAPVRAQGASPPNPAVQQGVPEAASETLHGRIIGLDRQTRQVILITPAMRYVSMVALPEIPLERLNLFDNVNVTFSRSVAFFVSMDVNAAATGTPALGSEARAPNGAAIRTRTIRAMVVGVHPASRTVDVVDPTGGGIRTVHVHDAARAVELDKLKPGEVITAVVTDALAASIQPARLF
jgi:hypothetical protein